MEPEPVRGELREWEAVSALVFDTGDVGFDPGVGAHVAVGFGSGWVAVGPVSPVSVGVGVEQGSSRAGVEGFASYDQSEVVFGPFVGFDVFGEFDHMGTNPLGFRIVDLRGVGVVNLGPVVSLRGVGVVNLGPVVSVVVLSWSGLGKGGLPAWVVYGDMG